jgi:EAL domain-containing protein (putative c-di-GMP-specific phosphodiesterase class I)
MFSIDARGEEVERRVAQSFARCSRHPAQFFAVMVGELSLPFNLTELGAKVEGAIRIEDTALLVGESKLVLLLEGHRHSSDPLRVAHRLFSELPGLVRRIGIAGNVGYYDSALEMYGAAERALEAATAEQPIRHGHAQLRRDAEYRLQFEDELISAVREGRLEPYFQPIVDLGNGQIRGFEALVRWKHPTEGLLLPENFLGIAKDCGLLPDLDRFILRKSLQQLELWSDQVDYPIRVNVNLCSDHFLNEGGVRELATIVGEHQSVIGQLRMDISEDVLRYERGLAALYTLQGLKIGFHLDDFIVSPESFRCLHSFPFDSLKVDRTLIAEMEEEVNAELIAAVLRIAQRMKIRTTAEGLVTHAQLEELRQLGCNEAQGFLFSPAIDAQAALEFLKVGPRW